MVFVSRCALDATCAHTASRLYMAPRPPAEQPPTSTSAALSIPPSRRLSTATLRFAAPRICHVPPSSVQLASPTHESELQYGRYALCAGPRAWPDGENTPPTFSVSAQPALLTSCEAGAVSSPTTSNAHEHSR